MPAPWLIGKSFHTLNHLAVMDFVWLIIASYIHSLRSFCRRFTLSLNQLVVFVCPSFIVSGSFKTQSSRLNRLFSLWEVKRHQILLPACIDLLGAAWCGFHQKHTVFILPGGGRGASSETGYGHPLQRTQSALAPQHRCAQWSNSRPGAVGG